MFTFILFFCSAMALSLNTPLISDDDGWVVMSGPDNGLRVGDLLGFHDGQWRWLAQGCMKGDPRISPLPAASVNSKNGLKMMISGVGIGGYQQSEIQLASVVHQQFPYDSSQITSECYRIISQDNSRDYRLIYEAIRGQVNETICSGGEMGWFGWRLGTFQSSCIQGEDTAILLAYRYLSIGKEEGPPEYIEPLVIDEVFVPSGSVWLGSPRSEKGREKDEERHLHHQPALSVMTHELTHGELYYLMNGRGADENNREAAVSNLKVEELKEIANRLSNTMGLSPCYMDEEVTITNCLGWRIPTEWEWEYIARGGETVVYSGVGSISELIQNGPSIQPQHFNGYGVAAMSGNIQEWVWCPERRVWGTRGGNWTGEGTRVADRNCGAKSGGLRLVRNIQEELF